MDEPGSGSGETALSRVAAPSNKEKAGLAAQADPESTRAESPFLGDYVEKLGTGPEQHHEPPQLAKVLPLDCSDPAAISGLRCL